MKGGCSGISVKCTLQSGGGFQVSFSGVMGLANLEMVYLLAYLRKKQTTVKIGGTRWPFTES